MLDARTLNKIKLTLLLVQIPSIDEAMAFASFCFLLSRHSLSITLTNFTTNKKSTNVHLNCILDIRKALNLRLNVLQWSILNADKNVDPYLH